MNEFDDGELRLLMEAAREALRLSGKHVMEAEARGDLGWADAHRHYELQWIAIIAKLETARAAGWRSLGDALGGAIEQIEAAYGETMNPKVEEWHSH